MKTIALCLFAGITLASSASAASEARTPFVDSIKDVLAQPQARVIRPGLTAAEEEKVLSFSVSLKMRHFDELEGRLAHGERISHDVMEAQYLPLASDYAAVRDWLGSQGFTITQIDPNHTNVFARGSVPQIEASLGVSFARVATADGEFTSVVSAPSLPQSISGAVLGIDGLQPQLRAHHQQAALSDAFIMSGAALLVPSDIRAAYRVPGALTGAGQTIAIICGGLTLASDVSTFYSTAGSSQSIGNVTTILINGGPGSVDFEPGRGATEATLDVEWAGGMAPNAKIRLYAVPDITNPSVIAACSQILADASVNHITVVSMSFCGPENLFPPSSLQSTSQMFAQLAAAGITALACSGDSGSNPNQDGTNGYLASNPLMVEYPASDPYVAGVGGTNVTFTSGSFSYVGETAWSTLTPMGENFASGGGVSSFFPRSVWQTGGSILSNSNRCVPDVAIAAGSQLSPPGPPGSVVYFLFANGSTVGSLGATSLATQLWAGIIADLNQSRANVGLTSIGLLGPAVYPLAGTNAFTDITTGSNGAYSAGPGYDLCTGLGSPNVPSLMAALGGSTAPIQAPVITGPPQSVTVSAGAGFSLGVTAIGAAPLTYQWFLNGSPIVGATDSIYSASSATAANGGSYIVVVANSIGSATSTATAVTVTPPPLPSPGGGAGGGGAPSYWFYLGLAALAGARFAQNRNRRKIAFTALRSIR